MRCWGEVPLCELVGPARSGEPADDCGDLFESFALIGQRVHEMLAVGGVDRGRCWVDRGREEDESSTGRLGADERQG